MPRCAWASVRSTPIRGQPATQQTLLKQLAEGINAIRQASIELGRWQDTAIVTYCEFGRRAKENQSNGTDHGTANTQFVIGGGVRGGFYGSHPSLTQLSGDGNLLFTTDYRALYSTLLTQWWGFSGAQSESARRQIRAAVTVLLIPLRTRGIRRWRGAINY